MLQRFLRFGVTGLLLTGLHTLIASSCITLAKLPPAIANGIAFALATGVSYVINTRWSFQAPLAPRTFRRFLLVSCAGLALSMLLAGLAQWWGIHYLGGILAVAILVPPITFLLHQSWTYKQ